MHPLAPKPAEHDPPADRGVVVVIDNDPLALQLFRRTLTREGYRVETAAGGVEGLRLARDLRPLAVVLDVQMPEMDGWAVLQAIKGDPALAGTPVIMATMVDEKSRGFALGVTDYLLKPVDRSRLFAILKGCAAPEAPAKPAPAPAAVAAPALPAPGIRVLIVEDDLANRTVLARTFLKQGWAVTEADNGLTALAAIAASPPDLIVLDLMMPGLDGFGLLREMKQRGVSNVPVVAISAKDLSQDERKLLFGCVRRVFQKGGYGREELLREVRSHLASRHPGPDATTAI